MTAHAEWKFDGDSDNFVSYIDYSRIATEGRYKSIWTLLDYKFPQIDSPGKQFKSSVTKRFIDCQGSRRQIVALYRYSEQMGKGILVWSDSISLDESHWNYSPPDIIVESFIKAACTSNSNPQDTKRQKCINLGLMPNSADFQQCMK